MFVQKLFFQYSCRSIHTKTLNSTKTCTKVRNSMFVTHCTVDTLDVVHTGSHAVAISEITELPHPPLFDQLSEFYKYLRKCKHTLV